MGSLWESCPQLAEADIGALWSCGEQKNAKICLPLGITIKSDLFSHDQDPLLTIDSEFCCGAK
jgi:hypothetical protein